MGERRSNGDNFNVLLWSYPVAVVVVVVSLCVVDGVVGGFLYKETKMDNQTKLYLTHLFTSLSPYVFRLFLSSTIF